MEGIRKAMNERNLNEGQWEDRKQWSLGVRNVEKLSEAEIYIYMFRTEAVENRTNYMYFFCTLSAGYDFRG